MDNSRVKKKSTDWTPIIVSIVLLVIGIIMIAAPSVALDVIVVVAAIAFLAYGVISVIYFICKKDKSELRKAFLLWPVITLILGILFLIFKEQVGLILPLFIGIWIFFSSICTLLATAKMISPKSKKFLIIMSIISLIIAVFFIVVACCGWTYAMVIVIGIILLVFGIISILSVIVQSSTNKKELSNSRVK